MKFRNLAATVAALMVSAPAFAQAEVGRASTQVADAGQFGGDSTILLILAILAFGMIVGWLAVAPRPATPDWNVGRKASAAELPEHGEDESIWATSCFFIRKDARGLGLTSTLLDAGTAYATKNGAKTVEACPMAHDDRRSTTGMFVGPKRVFDRAGFETVIERKPGRPLMRLTLKTTSTKKKPAAVTKAAKTKAHAPKGLKT